MADDASPKNEQRTQSQNMSRDQSRTHFGEIGDFFFRSTFQSPHKGRALAGADVAVHLGCDVHPREHAREEEEA